MQKNIPLNIERLSEEQENECRIISARQIQSILRNISETRSRAALHCDDEQDFIVTSLLDVGDKGFWVEQSTDMLKNRRAAETRKITLVSSLNQVKVQFSVNEIRAVTHQGYPAFYLPLPASLYRIQRREHFRLALPHSERLHCVIPINHLQAGGRIELPVMDISGGGMRLSCAEDNIEFEPGQTYAGCQINLPEVGKINVTIIVKSLVLISPKPGQTIKRVGCEFKNLDNASSILLQHYVTKMQRLKTDT
ncbi:MAG: flagellar regulator YcgR PilZN domain-containing protein [Candidatus Ferrigenium altingense]